MKKLGKKAQWTHAISRDIRSAEREERIYATFILLKKNKQTIPAISRHLGVSPATVKGYISEINDDLDIYEQRYKKEKEKEREKKEEEKKEEILLKKKYSRANTQVYIGKIVVGILRGVLFCLIALLWWWIPSLIWHFISGGKSDITHWIYSYSGFLIFSLVLGIIIGLNRVAKAEKERKKYHKYKVVIKKTEQTSKLKKNGYEVNCPDCGSKHIILVNEMPEKDKESTSVCKSCGNILEFSLPAKMYLCPGCKKRFKTIKEKNKHLELCKDIKD